MEKERPETADADDPGEAGDSKRREPEDRGERVAKRGRLGDRRRRGGGRGVGKAREFSTWVQRAWWVDQGRPPVAPVQGPSAAVSSGKNPGVKGGDEREAARDRIEGMPGARPRQESSAHRVHRQKKAFKRRYPGLKRGGQRRRVKEAGKRGKTLGRDTLRSHEREEGEAKERSKTAGTLSILTPVETRADVILWRSGRVVSMAQARHERHQGQVRRRTEEGVRDRVRRQPGYRLQPREVLEIRPARYTGRLKERTAWWADPRMTRGLPAYLQVDFERGRVCLESRPMDGEVIRPRGRKRTLASLKDTFRK